MLGENNVWFEKRVFTYDKKNCFNKDVNFI